LITGILPIGLLAYGLYAKRRGFVWVGAVWIGIDVLYWLSAKKNGAS
jgi:hypothetical protein